MLIGLCSSLIFAPSFLHFNILLIEVIPIEAMEPVKQLDSQVSQDLPVQEPPAPATATSTTPSTTDILAAYELPRTALRRRHLDSCKKHEECQGTHEIY